MHHIFVSPVGRGFKYICVFLRIGYETRGRVKGRKEEILRGWGREGNGIDVTWKQEWNSLEGREGGKVRWGKTTEKTMMTQASEMLQ